jgi:hypothetical protein
LTKGLADLNKFLPAYTSLSWGKLWPEICKSVSTLLLMFKNTYPPEFYRVLHSYVHKRFRKKENINKVKSYLKEKNSKIELKNILLPIYYSMMQSYYKRKLDAFK